jgi:NifU-like protein involved in Fe-S cluster formation
MGSPLNRNFTPKTLRLFQRKKYRGLRHNPEVTALAGNVRTGRFAVIGLTFSDGRISEARYRTIPCIPAIAASEWVCQWARGRTWDEIQSIRADQILDGLGGLPLSRHFCCHLVRDALLSAAEQAFQKQLLR